MESWDIQKTMNHYIKNMQDDFNIMQYSMQKEK